MAEVNETDGADSVWKTDGNPFWQSFDRSFSPELIRQFQLIRDLSRRTNRWRGPLSQAPQKIPIYNNRRS